MRPRAVACGLGLALLLVACAGTPDGGTTSAPSSSASTSPPPTATPTQPSPSVFTSFIPGTEVPVVLDFTGPKAGGGGEVKGADYAGRDVAIWFFNPT